MRRDRPEVGAGYVQITKPPEPTQKSGVVGVLTLSEAATRLGISSGEMEAMVKRRTVKSVVAGWTMMVPSDEAPD